MISDSNIKLLAKQYALSPNLSVLLWLFMNNDVVDRKLIEGHAIAASEAERGLVYRLRKIMEPHGVKITGHRTIGWWMSAGDKQRVLDGMGGG